MSAVTDSSAAREAFTCSSSSSSLGISPTLRLTFLRLSHSRSFPWAWEKDTSSSPEDTRAAMRFSSSGTEVRAMALPPIKAERS